MKTRVRRLVVLTAVAAIAAPGVALAESRSFTETWTTRDGACNRARDMGRVWVRTSGGTVDRVGRCECEALDNGYSCTVDIRYTPRRRNDQADGLI